LSCRTISEIVTMTTIIASSAAQNCSLVYSRQSASAFDTVVVATMKMGKLVMGRIESTSSSPWIMLVKRPVLQASSAAFMDGGRGHPAPESLLGVHAFHLHIIEDVILDALKVGHLLVEMARQQQRAVVELAFGDLQRAIAELQDETGGAERDRDHQGNSAKNQPLNRAHRCAGRHAVRVRELPLGTHRV
jgi:hypothetical protein